MVTGKELVVRRGGVCAGIEPPRMWVNGRCRREGCGAWFTAKVEYTYALHWLRDGMFTVHLPGTCSVTCTRAMARARRAAEGRPVLSGSARRKKREREAREAAALAGQPVGQPVGQPDVKKAARARKKVKKQAIREFLDTCPACFLTEPSTGPGGVRMPVCDDCMTVVEVSCRGKVRHDVEADAVDAAGVMAATTGNRFQPYPCPVCRWWHIGSKISRAAAKRIRFTAATFVDHADPKWLAGLRIAWFESRSGWRRQWLKASSGTSSGTGSN